MFGNILLKFLIIIVFGAGIPALMIFFFKKNTKDIKDDNAQNKKPIGSMEYEGKKMHAEDYAKIWNPGQFGVKPEKFYKDNRKINKNYEKTSREIPPKNSIPECFKILGFDKKPSEEELKKSYRNLVKKYHPDKNSGNSDAFEEINKAYKEAKRYY